MNESSILFLPSIPKTLRLRSEENLGEPYRRLHLYLGNLAGLALMRPTEIFFERFQQYLDNCFHGAGKIFWGKITNLHPSLISEIKKNTLSDFLLLTEVPFVPALTQMFNTERLLKYQRLGQNTRELVVKIISGENIQIVLPTKKTIGSNDLFSVDINQFSEIDQKFIISLREAVSYYYFDFSHSQKAPVKRALTLASARIDGLVLIGTKFAGYEEKEIRRLFSKFLLSPTNFTDREKILLNRLINDIFLGKVRFMFLEIKSHFFNETNSSRDTYLRDISYLRDVSHSVLAMFEFLTSAVRLCGLENDPRFSFLFSLMDQNYEKRFLSLVRSRHFLRLLRENYFGLVNISWPILDRKLDENQKEEILLNRKKLKETTPLLIFCWYSSERIIRAVRDRAERMFEEIQSQKSEEEDF